jgi:hypothetical protein
LEPVRQKLHRGLPLLAFLGMRGRELGLLALLIHCGAGANDGDPVADACIADNPPPVPFDTGDSRFRPQPAPAPGGTRALRPPPTAEDIAQACRAGGGSGCDAATFISKQAAICIASERELALGVRPWDVALNYYGNHQRVAWGITTVDYESSDGSASGAVMVLDAVSGAELNRGVYVATP